MVVDFMWYRVCNNNTLCKETKAENTDGNVRARAGITML